MKAPIKIEIIGRDDFWSNAVLIEWKDQFPDRPLVSHEDGCYLINEEWLEDLRLVAKQCFSKIRVAPLNPSRRQLFKRFLNHHEDDR